MKKRDETRWNEVKRKKKENQGIYTAKEIINYIYKWYDLVYKESEGIYFHICKKLLDLINNFSKVAVYMINMQN